MNILTLYSTDIIERVKNKGARRVIKLIWETFDGNILDVKRLKMEIQGKYQIRLASVALQRNFIQDSLVLKTKFSELWIEVSTSK